MTIKNWTSQPAFELHDLDLDRHFTCDDCAEVHCAVCGHEPCPCCLDCCDHPDCLVEDKSVEYEGTPEEHTQGLGIALKKTHTCSFTPCEKHKAP